MKRWKKWGMILFVLAMMVGAVPVKAADISAFCELKYFITHPQGQLIYDGNQYLVDFVAVVETDPDDGEIVPGKMQRSEWEGYLSRLLGQAVHRRQIPVSSKDSIVLINSPNSTDKQCILVGKIVENLSD